MTSFDCIKKIMEKIEDDAVVIASTGYISREVYAARDRALNFYMQGSMGAALAIGLGMALNSKLAVHVIAGDGAMLMSLGTLVLVGHRWDNLHIHIIDNGCHASTGGQKTVKNVPWNALANCDVWPCRYAKTIAPRIPLTCRQIKERFENAVHDLLRQSKH